MIVAWVMSSLLSCHLFILIRLHDERVVGQAALDPRIELSIPIAGSIPCSFGHSSIDFEQFCERPYNRECDYECQYVLAGLEKERYSVQIIHEFDPCCFQCD
eukprot:COSAG02_NODE_7769_length_2855_cov_3.173440_1_plen_102_part_00